jgi:hypothetical protein
MLITTQNPSVIEAVRVQFPPQAPEHNPTKSKEVQNPLEIVGFFLLFVQRRAIRFNTIQQLWGLIRQ